MRPSAPKQGEGIFSRLRELAGKVYLQAAFRKRVRKGIGFLNTVKPGWWERIDLERLDMLHTRLCLCGQLYGRHKNAYRVLRLSPADFVMYGFLPDGRDYRRTKGLPQDLLTRVWTRQIKKLKRRPCRRRADI